LEFAYLYHAAGEFFAVIWAIVKMMSK